MEIYQIEYVLSVAKYKNFSRAATEACVTPSSLSQQIKKLEDELGVVLFGRTTRSVHLTPAGTEFIEHAKKILEDIATINQSMQKYVDGESGEISIGGIPALGAYSITPLIASFKKNYPQISLEFHEAECLDLYPLLFHNKINIAFLTAYEQYKTNKSCLEAFPLVKDEIVIITSLSHPFAKQQSVSLQEAKEEKFICLSHAAGIYLDSLEACHSAGFEPNFVYDTYSVDTCIGLVAEGMGIAMLSSCIAKSTTRKDIAIVRINPIIPRILSVVLLKNQKLSPALSNFKNFLIHWSRENDHHENSAKH